MSMKPVIFLAFFSIMVLCFQNCSGGGASSLKTDLKSPTDLPSNEPEEPNSEGQTHQKVVSIDPKAQTIFQRIIVQGKNVAVDDLIIEVSEYDGQLVNTAIPGICIKEANKTPKIILKQADWDLISDGDPIASWNKVASLAYHFGKCFLNREDNLTLNAGMPVSFMNPNWRFIQFWNGNAYWFESDPNFGFSEYYWDTPYFIE